MDQYHPDVEGADPGGLRDAVTDLNLGAAFFAELGVESPVAQGAFFDLFPLSLITESTLEQLRTLAPESDFDARRFRMNATIAASRGGFVENSWIGRRLTIGDAVELTVTTPDPRCVMTTLSQADLPNDHGILKALVRHNYLDLGEGAHYPCAGVYAVTRSSGSIRIGDRVDLGAPV